MIVQGLISNTDAIAEALTAAEIERQEALAQLAEAQESLADANENLADADAALAELGVEVDG